MLGTGEEVQNGSRVGEVPHLGAVLRRQTADHRGESGGPFQPRLPVQRLPAGKNGAEGLGLSTLLQERLRGPDHPEGVALALLRGVAPRGDSVAAEDHADRLGIPLLDGRDVESQLEAGPAPADPGDLVAEALGGQLLTVGRARQRDPRVRVQMVDVRGLDERVHRGVDRRGRASFAVQAVVEGGDHLVLAVHPRVHVLERPYPVQPEHGETGLGQRPEVPARALDPEEFGLSTGDRIGRRRLGRGVAAGVVRVAGSEPIRWARSRSAATSACVADVMSVPSRGVRDGRVRLDVRRRGAGLRRPSPPARRRRGRRRCAPGCRRRGRRRTGPGPGRVPRGPRPAAAVRPC